MEKELTIPYTIILNKLHQNSYNGEIEIHKARKILSHYFRFPKDKIGRMFIEMKDSKIISMNNKFIKINCGLLSEEDSETQDYYCDDFKSNSK